jgi:hypothetical protein
MVASASNIQLAVQGPLKTAQMPDVRLGANYLTPASWYVGPTVKDSMIKGQHAFDLPTTYEKKEQVPILPLSLQVPTITGSQRGITSTLLAEWQGCVTSIDSDSFTAELHGLVGIGVAGAVELAEIPVSDVRFEDKTLFREGAFFRLCISYEKSPTGNLRRYTEVIFRRLPAYTQRELEEAREDAQEFMRGLRLE